MNVAQSFLPFKLEVEKEAMRVTAHGGLPLVVEALRATTTKSRYRELRDALAYHSWRTVRRHVESLVALIAAGGDCLDDLHTLRGDPALKALLGFEVSSPTQAKDFLYRFHQDRNGQRLTRREDVTLSCAGQAQIREEGPGLRALALMVHEVMLRLQGRRSMTRATLDVDATLVEANKANALRAYEGTVGYQPQMAWWAEQRLWVKDEFRDGNVPAAFAVLEFVQRAVHQLPDTVTQRRLRADSALYDEKLLTWADDAKIAFAVSADMTPALRDHVIAVENADWKPYHTLRATEPIEDPREERQWADVPSFIPGWERNFRNGTNAFRYIAVRVRSRQRELWENTDGWRHFAVVTNMDWDGERLLRWHREKQGTVEHAHGVLKNELAAGTLPASRFGANAAFWRLNVLVHNLLELMKAVALPPQMNALKPKALRFRVFALAGRVVHHGRELILKIAETLPFASLYAQARTAIQSLAALSTA